MSSDTAAARFDFGAPVPAADTLGAVHFVAAGGAGVSGVAHLYLARGSPVSGSDQRASDALDALGAAGATVHVGHDPAHLAAADTVVISGAVPETNPELQAARSRGLRVLHRAQAIAALLQGRPSVAVAGANGKTTTSAMLTVALQAGGLDPGYVVGSTMLDSGLNAAPGSGPMVVEADESDGSFLAYRPSVAVVTNIAADHLDYYGDLAGVRRAFRAFVDTLPADGVLIASVDDPLTQELIEHARSRGARVFSWGESDAADLQLLDAVSTGGTSRARLVSRRTSDGVGGGQEHRLELPMPGVHNLHNAAAALLAGVAGFGLAPEVGVRALAGFAGTARRFQAVGSAGGVDVIDDYAHNPDKVAAAVAAGRSVLSGERRLVVAFQPHLYSRTRSGAEGFAAGLAPADVVVLLDVYGAREDPIESVSSALIAERLPSAEAGGPILVDGGTPDEAPQRLAALVRDGDLVMTIGAGDVTAVGPRLLALLEETC